MVLYNIVLGNQKLIPDSWSHITDEHGNHFITKEDIKQRIRIDNRVDPSIYPELGELKPEWSTANMQCYNVLPNTRWANNNRNMNPLLLMGKKDNNKKSEQIVVYITVNNNYSIVRFNTPHRILQTYHKKNVFQGCVVVLNYDEIDNNNNIITISVYDKKNKQYTEFNIHFIKENKDKVLISRKGIGNPKVLETIKSQFNKFDDRYMGFKIITKPKELLTVTYLTSDKFKDDIVNKTKNINNVNIITINQEQIEDPNSLNTITENLQKIFNESRIRAITQCGVNLPLDVIRKLKLLYVFNYDVKNDKLSCRKSN